MSCSCRDPSCTCLERCCCPSKFCVCTACFNLRNAAVVLGGNKPFEFVSTNASNDSQNFDVTNTDCHLKDEGLIQISSSSFDELESDVVFIGSYDINREVNKCSSPRVIFPEIVLSDSDEPVFTVGEDNFFKITSENRNRSRNLKRRDFCHFTNKGTVCKRKRPYWNRKSDQNSYRGFRKKVNVSRFYNRSHASLEQHEVITVPDNVDVQVIEDSVSQNSNFNRYFSQASSSAYIAQENEIMQESPVSNIRNNSLKSETNRYINENNASENSNFKRYFSKASSSCSAYKYLENETTQDFPVSNIRNNSLKSETNRCINKNSVIENSNFNRYFSKASASCSAVKSQEKETKQKSPVSNIRNNSLKSETNQYINENNVTEKSNFNKYFSEASSSSSAYNAQENETMQESLVSNIRNNSLKSETNQYINENNVTENSNFNRYVSEASLSWNAYNDQGNEITQETPVSNIRNDSLELKTNRCGLFTHKPHFNCKKQKSSWNNSISALNQKKMFSEMATILQPDEVSFSPFGQQTDFSSAMETVMQTNKDSAAEPSTFDRNRGKNFPDESVYDFDEKDPAINLSDQSSLTRLKSHKRHVQSDNSGGLTVNIHPAVSHRGYSEINSFQNIDACESGSEAARKDKHVSFLLPSCHSSSEICNDYQQSYLNSLQNTDDGELGYKTVKNGKRASFANPCCHSSLEICNDCRKNYAIRKKIIRKWRKKAKRRDKKGRTCPVNEFTDETMSTSKLRHKGKRRKRSISCKVGQAAIRNEIKKEKIYFKRKTKKENGFVKTEINYIKREVKKEEP